MVATGAASATMPSLIPADLIELLRLFNLSAIFGVFGKGIDSIICFYLRPEYSIFEA